jgi:hypothetical protein
MSASVQNSLMPKLPNIPSSESPVFPADFSYRWNTEKCIEADASLGIVYRSLLCGWFALSACGCERGGMAWGILLVCSGEEKNKSATPAKMFINAHILSAFMHAKMILVLEELGPLGRRHRGSPHS